MVQSRMFSAMAVTLVLLMLPGANLTATSTNAQGVHRLVNQQRAQQGLPALAYDERLERTACAKAADMVSKNYWGHTAGDGRSPWYFIHQADISYRRVGENLAYGYQTSERVVSGWMNSRGHRKSALSAKSMQLSVY